MGMIADAMRVHLQQIAQSDAKALRATEEMLSSVRAQIAASEAPLLAGSQDDEIAAAIELLQSAGYTVTPPTV